MTKSALLEQRFTCSEQKHFGEEIQKVKLKDIRDVSIPALCEYK